MPGIPIPQPMLTLHQVAGSFENAMIHRNDARVRYDVWIYLGFALFFATLAPFRSRWRMLVGGLLGCGLGSYLLVDLRLVARKPFIIGLGAVGLVVALGAFAYVRRGALAGTRFGKHSERKKTKPNR